MGLEYSDVVRFDFSPSFKVKRGQPNLKGFMTHLLLILEVCNMKPTCRILWAVNLLMSDLTFGPSFKVKQWFTGFGELSFRWIQICIGSPMCRSSLFLPYIYFIIAFTALEGIPYMKSLYRQSDLSPDPLLWVKLRS